VSYINVRTPANLISGEGINFLAVNGNQKDVTLIMSRVLCSIGGAITVTSTQVAAQGSVPHTDMALAMAVLSLWTSMGGSIASAISAAVWTKQVPANLEKYLGEYYNATERAEIFGSILVARAAEPHHLVNQAYTESLRGLYIGALVTSMLALVAGMLTKEFILGAAHNTIETNKEIRFRSKEEVSDEAIAQKVAEAEAKALRELEAGK
jgi:MFS family permease